MCISLSCELLQRRLDRVLTSKSKGDGPLKVGDFRVWIYVLSPEHTRERRLAYEAERERLEEIDNLGVEPLQEEPSEITKVHEIPEISVEEVQNATSNHVRETGANQFIELENDNVFQDDTFEDAPLNSDPFLSSTSVVEVDDRLDIPLIGIANKYKCPMQ